MPLLTFAAYARHRGVSRAAVTYAVNEGRIPTFPDPKTGKRLINSDVADKAWNANTQPERRKMGVDPASAGEEVSVPDETGQTNKPKLPSISESRAIKEAYQARLAKVLFEEKVNKLLDADQVKKEAFETGRIIRDSLLNLPSRLASEFAVEMDPLKIHNRLTKEIIAALEELYNVGRRI